MASSAEARSRLDASYSGGRDSINTPRLGEKGTLGPKLPPLLNRKGLLTRLVMEGLGRKDIAGALVFSALDSVEGQPEDEGCPCATGTSASDEFGASDLDNTMKTLLAHSVSDLEERLWGGADGPTPANPREPSRRVMPRQASRAPAPEHGHACQRLLLVLQMHIASYWGDATNAPGGGKAARKICLAHAARLLEASLRVLSRILDGGSEKSGDGATDTDQAHHVSEPRRLDALRGSFLELLPLLSASLVALPEGTVSHVSLAAELLPLALPVARVLDRLILPRREAPQGGTDGASVHPPTEDSGASVLSWLTGLEEALAMLLSDMACHLMEAEAWATPEARGLGRQGRADAGGHAEADGNVKRRDSEAGDHDGDVIDLMLASLPFLRHARECFVEERGSLSAGHESVALSKVTEPARFLCNSRRGPLPLPCESRKRRNGGLCGVDRSPEDLSWGSPRNPLLT